MKNVFNQYARASLCCLALAVASAPSFGQYVGDQQAKLVVTQPVTFMHETRNVEAVGSAEAVRSVTLFSLFQTRLKKFTLYRVNPLRQVKYLFDWMTDANKWPSNAQNLPLLMPKEPSNA